MLTFRTIRVYPVGSYVITNQNYRGCLSMIWQPLQDYYNETKIGWQNLRTVFDPQMGSDDSKPNNDGRYI